MKIVINSCFGGFSLSIKAVHRMAELQGRRCYWFDLKGNKYYPTLKPDSFSTAFDIPNPNEVLGSLASWHDASLEERQAQNQLYCEHVISSRPDHRTDKLLIQVVEELGDDANGTYASLKVVEIPDDVEWFIDDYDGVETIREKHRSWS